MFAERECGPQTRGGQLAISVIANTQVLPDPSELD